MQSDDMTGGIQAERLTRQKESGFQTVDAVIPNHVWTARPDGFLDWFNERTAEYTGKLNGIGMEDGWEAFVHPDDVCFAMERWSDVLRTGETYEAEFRIRRVDGAYRRHIARALPMRDASGKIQRWIGTNTDIYERKLAEVESTRDRDRMWSLSQELMLVFDFNGIITVSNPAITRICGWGEDELVGQPLMHFLHPDDVARTVSEIMRVAPEDAGAAAGAMMPQADGIPVVDFQNSIATKSGQRRRISWTIVPEAGKLYAFGRDVTAEQEAGAALAASLAERERIWASTNDLMGTGGVGGCCLKSVNPAWGRLLGYTDDQLLSEPFTVFADEVDRAVISEAMERLALGEAIRDIETRLIHADGKRSLISWVGEPFGDIFYMVGRNVTEQRAAEDALRQSYKMEVVGQLTGGIAHDFNNLLQGITGSLDLLQKRIAQGRVGELGPVHRRRHECGQPCCRPYAPVAGFLPPATPGPKAGTRESVDRLDGRPAAPDHGRADRAGADAG